MTGLKTTFHLMTRSMNSPDPHFPGIDKRTFRTIESARRAVERFRAKGVEALVYKRMRYWGGGIFHGVVTFA